MKPADSLFAAVASHRLIGPFSDEDPSLDEPGAYAIAREVHERRLERGEKPVGRKIGFTNRTIWHEYGVWAPIWGHVYDSTVSQAEDGAARVRIGHLLQPRIEPEIQLHFLRAPPASGDERAILECVDWIAQGFEIVQCPFPNWQFRAVDTIVAFALHGALVLGTPVPVEKVTDCVAQLRTFRVELSKDGDVQKTGGGAEVLGSPLRACAHLVDVLSTQPETLPIRAGEIISTGTLTTPLPVLPGETWTTVLAGIDLPGLSITFE
jgi:2-keto-4-pentenoate hydratase